MLVMDCSAAVNIALSTQDGSALRQLILTGEAIIAPDLLVPEAANVISKYVRGGYLSAQNAQKAFESVLELVDEYVRGEELCVEALSESVRLDFPAYDLFYLVLARRSGATLMTLDKGLQKLCMQNGVNCVFTDDGF